VARDKKKLPYSTVTNNAGITENETEVSFFNFEAYEEYKKNPDIKW
jgi:hypothetical protein